MNSLLSAFSGIPLSSKTQKLADEISGLYREIENLELKTALPENQKIDELDQAAGEVVKAKAAIEKIRIKIPILERNFIPFLVADVQKRIDELDMQSRDLHVAAEKVYREHQAAEQLARRLKVDADTLSSRAGAPAVVAAHLQQQIAALTAKDPQPRPIASELVMNLRRRSSIEAKPKPIAVRSFTIGLRGNQATFKEARS